jgi:endo-1,4-beta-D-glucanase Y
LAYPGAARSLIQPDADQQADDIRVAWSRWKQRYLVRRVEDGEVRYWVRHAKPGHADGWDRETVSEGMGYGMILAAHMAGDDERAREIFDGLWRFARAHPSSGDSRLMQWRVRPDGRAASDDSAFDGDCDMAFALLLAEAQWGNDGSIDYRAAFDQLIAGIEDSTIGPESGYPLLGDWVRPQGGGAGGRYSQWTTRTSDVMPGHFRAFRRATGRAVWDHVLGSTQGLFDLLQEQFSPGTGLLPDFVQPTNSANSNPRPADAGFLEGRHDGHFFYNAGRTPWRLATDALMHNDETSRRQALAMARWAREAADGAPRNVKAGYALDGEPLADSNFFSTFFAAPFGVAAMLDADAGAESWLAAVYDAVRDAPQDYYEDSVSLLCLLVMSGNFWSPEA